MAAGPQSSTRSHSFWTFGPALLLLLGAISMAAEAATFCIQAGDVVGMQTALATADSNGEDDLIELQAGTFLLPSNFQLYYSAGEARALTIEGGYGEFFGNPCGLAPQFPDARQTVIQGGHIVWIESDPLASITVKALTITETIETNQLAVPVQIGGAGSVALYNTAFFGNVSFDNPAIYLSVGHTLIIQNSLFAQNAAFANFSPIYIKSTLNAPDAICIEIIQSTFVENSTSAWAVTDVSTPSCRLVAANDIFWNPGSEDLHLWTPATAYLTNIDIKTVDDVANAQTSSIVSVSPSFKADFSLSDYSRLRNTGVIGVFAFSNGAYDTFGNPRIDGPYPDIGAFEIQDVIFADAFNE
jgi:hypothetical protein